MTDETSMTDDEAFQQAFAPAMQAGRSRPFRMELAPPSVLSIEDPPETIRVIAMPWPEGAKPIVVLDRGQSSAAFLAEVRKALPADRKQDDGLLHFGKSRGWRRHLRRIKAANR